MTTEAVADTPLYTHPNIRDLAHDKLAERLDIIRGKRLVAAQEFRTQLALRLEKEHTKLGEQWERLAASMSKRVEALKEAVDKFDADLNKLQQISNQMKVME